MGFLLFKSLFSYVKEFFPHQGVSLMLTLCLHIHFYLDISLQVFSLSELFKGPSLKVIARQLVELRQLIRLTATRGSVIEMQPNNFNGQQAAILLNNDNAQELGTA